MKLDRIVEGKHNREHFRYNDGFLEMYGRKWDKADIKTLIETANLLEHQGYTLKVPTGRTFRTVDNLFGQSIKVERKTYDDIEEGE